MIWSLLILSTLRLYTLRLSSLRLCINNCHNILKPISSTGGMDTRYNENSENSENNDNNETILLLENSDKKQLLDNLKNNNTSIHHKIALLQNATILPPSIGHNILKNTDFDWKDFSS